MCNRSDKYVQPGDPMGRIEDIEATVEMAGSLSCTSPDVGSFLIAKIGGLPQP